MSDTPSPAAGPAPARLLSLDVFRGATIAAMMLVNNPGDWGAVYAPLLHAPWHGWTFTDTIFPFFLWIVGVAIPLSVARRLEQGQRRRDLFRHALRRALILFGVGFLLNSFGYLLTALVEEPGWNAFWHHYLTTIRLPGVLQRIAVCYLAAVALFLTTDVKGQVRWLVGLLLGYWLLMKLVPVPPPTGMGEAVAGSLAMEHNLAHFIDHLLLNGPRIGRHVWAQTATWDPEGVLSTLPAIGTALFGLLTGQLLRSARTPAEKTAWILAGGAILAWVGQLMNLAFPINKPLWTSSYAVFMAGLAMLTFGTTYWLVDVRGHRRWAQPLAIYGMNAITVYVVSWLLADLLTRLTWATPAGRVGLKSLLYGSLLAPLPSAHLASLLWGLLWVLLLFAVALVMYRRRWFVRF